MKDAPLAGIKVLDFTQFLSGPYCTQILADLGAEVIKAEAPEGDLARHIPPHFVGRDSVYFIAVNRSKKSLAVDLKTAAGREVLNALAASCDVIVENFRPGVVAKLGIDQERLRAERPELVWCSISGFGQDGPYRDKPAYDMIVQALSGGMSLTGEPKGRAVRSGIPIGDIAAGMYAAIGILGALFRRERTTRGDAIDIAMLDCQAAMLSYQGAYFLHSGHVPGRQGSGHDSIPTYRSFTAADGQEVVITANTERMWQGLCRVLGLSELTEDPRFRTNRERFVHREALWALLEPAFASATAAEWVTRLEGEAVPASVVKTLDAVMDDPQILHRGMIRIIEDGGRSVRVMGDPLRFAEAQSPEPGYPPQLGEHTHEVLKGILGLSDAAIDRLVDSRAVALSHATPVEA
ncbi:CoA transferase [Ancylobacter sp. A5.8]|uniref:CaiB/BaiF CoA transferase family protein n=1 Tax=Ancylobacter gelatini TaxID=2919920 RepID=UPI001F4D4AA4|nr:CoA transferase [Ancylobacter gelatini]MCJ8144009.1 CoA transferase [Ancylobacter gelatini]